MRRERQAILSLIALGKVTPREAERLLAAWNAGCEELWALAVCAGVGVMQSLPGLGRMAHAWLPAVLPGLHHGVAVVTYWMGGMR